MLAVSCRLLDLTDGLSSTIVIVSSKTLEKENLLKQVNFYYQAEKTTTGAHVQYRE